MKFVNKRNVYEIQNRVEYMYVKTLERIKTKLRQPFELTDLEKDVLISMKNVKFMEYFVRWVMNIIKYINVSSIQGHTLDCLVRCSFDLVFRFVFDINYIPINIGDEECRDFLDLQLKIFRDCGYTVK